MEPNNQPSPYFVRRSPSAPGETIDVHDYAIVEDQVHPLRDYWLIAKRHRWLIVSCALVSFIAAALYVFTRTPLYTSEATVLIERRAPQILNLRDARGDAADFNDYNNEFYKTQYEILKSRSLAERVVRDQGLEKHPLFGGNPTREAVKDGLISDLWRELKAAVKSLMPADPKSETRNPKPDPIPASTRLAGRYLSLLEVRPVAGTSLVTIKITTPEPALSARLADAHASSYVRYGIDLRSQTNSEAGEFLQQKLIELKERIEQSEAALNSYRKAKGIISVDEKSNVIIERLLDLNKGLTAAESERIAWEAQVRAARGRSVDEIPAVRNSSVISGLKSELGKFEAEHAALAKEFKPGYPPLDNLRARIDETRRRLSAEIGREVRSIEANYAAASSKENQLRAAMDEQKRATLDLKDSAVQYAILAREVDTNKQLYDGVLSRLKEIGVAAEVRSSNIHVMGKALPGALSYPDKRRTMMLGLLLGLAAGIGLAFLLEQLDNSLKTPEEAERYLRLANLGSIPDFAAVNGNAGFVSKLIQSAHAELPLANRRSGKDFPAGVLLDQDPLSVVSEAYRSFRSALLLSQAGGPPHSMLVTSAGRGDGKTTTLVNTAIVFAQLGIRVVVVDADLRRPACHMFLRAENKAGLADLLAGQLDLETAIRPTPAENLFFISAGAIPPNPAELLGSQKMHELLEQLRQQFAFVFIDSSPVLAVSDAVFLSTMVEGTLLVVNSRTPKPLVKKARARLALAQSKILGMVLNQIDVRSSEYGGYYQQYYTYYRNDERPALTNGAAKTGENGSGRESRENKGRHASRPKTRTRQTAGNEAAAEPLNSTPDKPYEPTTPTVSLHLGDEKIITAGAPQHSFPEFSAEELSKRKSAAPEFPDRNLDENIFNDAKIKALNGIDQADIPAATAAPVGKTFGESRRTAGFPINGGEFAQVGKTDDITTNDPVGEKFLHLPPEFMKIVSAKLADAIGPIAPVILRERARVLGDLAAPPAKAKLQELAKELAGEIPHDSQRRRFEKEMAAEIERIQPEANGGESSRPGPIHTVAIKTNRASEPAENKDLNLSPEFMNILSGKLAEALGPIAPLVLQEKILAVGALAHSFPKTKLDNLMTQLSREILHDSMRNRFRAEMAKEMEKI